MNHVVGRWIPAIINHLYHVIGNTEPNTVLRKEWWMSVFNHICDVHQHPEHTLFKACAHGTVQDIVDDDGEVWTRQWLDRCKNF